MTSRVLCRVEKLLELASADRAVLGLDTGTSPASLALIADGRVVGEISRPVRSHGAALADAAQELLNAGEISPRALTGIAVGIGPGSFTGLRIGVSYAKGIAFATGCAIAGVPSLDAIALGVLENPAAHPGIAVCPILDARKGEVYTALYRIVADGLEKVSNDLVMPLNRLTEYIEASVILAGDGRADEAAALLSHRGIETLVADPRTLASRGRYIALLGAARIARGEADSADPLQPLYVRPPEAQAAHAASAPKAIPEGVWNTEKKNSFGSI